MMLLNASNIGKIFNGTPLFEGASFNIEKGDKIGLVGVNGAGKTTLMRMIMGQLPNDMGEMFFSKETRVAYMEQHACSESEQTVYDEVLAVFAPVMEMERELKQIQREIDAGSEQVDALVKRQFALNEEYERQGGFTYQSRTRSCLLGLGFTEHDLTLPVSALSGGQKTRVLLARILLSGSNLLLLDEPTNHLDIQSVMWLEDFLQSYEGAVLVISHDRYFLDKVTRVTYEMAAGRLTIYPGNYSKYLVLREEDRKTRTRNYENTLAQIGKLEESARLLHSFNREKSVKRAESKEKQIEKLSATLQKVETDDIDLHFSFSPQVTGGNEVLKCEALAKAFGEKKLFTGVDLFVTRGERVFLLGPNGCGKTTLLKMILEQEQPDAGSIKLGANVTPAYYEQTGAELLNGKDALSEVWDAFPAMTQTEVRSALAAFLFTGEDVYKEVAMLSGGERARIAILKILLKRGNLLVLDEPTNHLDIASREALEQALQEYSGTILCVSHDRYFINKLAGCIYEMKPEGLTKYVGDYDDYRRNRAEEEQQATAEKQPSKGAMDYRAKKEYESNRRKAQTALKRAEETVSALEEELQQQNDLLCTDEVAGSYEKAMEVTERVHGLEQQLEQALEEWERAGELVASYEEEN